MTHLHFSAVEQHRLQGCPLGAHLTASPPELPPDRQLSYDALKAFPSALVAAAEVYYWPIEKRERNQAGKPSKLHAKLAVIDNLALVSSANLTGDAFSRNLEVGVMIKSPSFFSAIRGYLDALISDGTLCQLHGGS